MKHILHLKCLICGEEYQPDEIDYICPNHGNDGIVDVRYDYDAIGRRVSKNSLGQSKDYSIWRYRPLLPVTRESAVPPLQIGWTPLYHTPRLADGLGLKHLWVKDDGRQPTASFKDRASAIALVKAREKTDSQGSAPVITTASTGNAAAALSGICASVRHPNVIFQSRRHRQKLPSFLYSAPRSCWFGGRMTMPLNCALKRRPSTAGTTGIPLTIRI